MPESGNRAPGAPRTTISASAQSPAAPNDSNQVELNMRRALGLTGTGNGRTGGPVVQQRPEQARQRHRFAQDGSVAVTVLNHRPDELAAKDTRIRELEASLKNERDQHGNTRRTVSEQQAAMQALQTRLAHMELAHRDALETERKSLAVAQEALVAARAAPQRRAIRLPEATEPAEPAKAKRGRPRIHPPREPKPVRWWTPSFKAKG